MSRPSRACVKDIDYSFFDRATPTKSAQNKKNAEGVSARSQTKPKSKARTPKASPAPKASNSASKKRKIATPTPDKPQKRPKKVVRDDGEDIENRENRRGNRTPAKETSPSELAARALTDKLNQPLQCPPSIAKRTPGYATRAVSAKYNRLMERYQEIKEIRTTEPEQKYVQLKAIMENHKNVSERLIAQLNADLKKLQEENDALKKHAPDSHKISEADVAMEKARKQNAHLQSKLDQTNKTLAQKDQEIAALKEDVRKLREKAFTGETAKEVTKPITASSLSGGLVDFYELITSLRVQPLAFSFEASMSASEVEYTPIESSTSEMPECLREAIYFEKSKWPVFLAKIITSLYAHQQE